MTINKRWQFRFLLFFGFAPLVAAWVMIGTGVGIPAGTSNHGELMSPGLVVPKQVNALQGGRWGLVMIGDHCEQPCKDQLVLMQQVHKSLGKEFGRMQSIWFKYEDHELFPAENSGEPDSVPSRVTEEMSAWLTAHQLPNDDYSIWLIDPLGNLVLRFSPGTDGRDILTDIRFLLKASKVG
ncbi:MAG: hypothetical protein KUG72_12410 [Pseudomonadales bacterium]|nr:hypothetical protein [Pseudomonadales bacterium]